MNTPPKNPYPPLICGEMTSHSPKSAPIRLCQSHTNNGQMTKADGDSMITGTQIIKSCHNAAVINFKFLTGCQALQFNDGAPLGNQIKATTHSFTLLNNCTKPKLSAVHKLMGKGLVNTDKTVLYTACHTPSVSAVNLLFAVIYHRYTKVARQKSCLFLINQPARPVPCRYYPIAPKKDDTPIYIKPCADLPPAYRLPLPLTRKAGAFKAYAHALPLTCAYIPPADTPKPPADTNTPIFITPPLHATQKGYIMHHTITASFDNISIHPLRFEIKTDMTSFCFSGQIEIGTADFNAIQDKLNTNHATPKLIQVAINDSHFAFICEEITHTQAFAKHTITLSGRSPSAHLAKEYAKAAPLDDVDLYASQIVAKQLEHLSISAKFAIDDYLIPKGSYSTTGKTPIGVLDDIAKACGGFLYSEPSRAVIHLLPRHKTPAWHAKTADVILAKDRIKSLSTTAIKQPLYNTVTLVGQVQGGIVYRADMGQDKDAPVSDNPLYTDQANIIKAGIAILSDSGDKTKITLSTPFTALAVIGDVWQIGADGGQNGNIGIVQAVSVSVSVNDGVVSSWQTVTLLGDKAQATQKDNKQENSL